MTYPDYTDHIADFCPYYFHCRIVVINFGQMFTRYIVSGVQGADLLLAHDLMVGHHDMFQHIQFGAQ